MRQWALDAGKLTSDGVAYTAAASGSLTQAANRYFVLAGANVPQYRLDELIVTIDWLTAQAIAGFDTARFPRPSGAGVRGSFLKARLVADDHDPKHTATLVTSTDMTTHPLSDDDAVYVGITAAAAPPDVNYAWTMGSNGLWAAVEKIKAAILMKRPTAISSLAITPSSGTKAAAATEQLLAIATYADGSTDDVTLVTSYSSSDTTKGTVSINGLVTAVATGSATITGVYRGATDTYALTVS